MVPDDSLTIPERAVAAWPSAWQGHKLRDILTTLGHDMDVPWRKLSKKLRNWILFVDEQPTVPVCAGFSRAEMQDAIQRKLTPSYMGTFTGARRRVLHTFANSQSALMKKRGAQYQRLSIDRRCMLRSAQRLALITVFALLRSLPASCTQVCDNRPVFQTPGSQNCCRVRFFNG